MKKATMRVISLSISDKVKHDAYNFYDPHSAKATDNLFLHIICASIK